MNERIRELMPKPWTFPYPDSELYTKEQFEKFAELIVQECAKVATMNQYQSYTTGHYVLKHFGVEE